MRYTVRRVTTADRKKTVGYGVFMDWNIGSIPEQGSVCIDHCTDPGDVRRLRELPDKSYKMKGLYPSSGIAEAEARQLSTQKYR